MNYQLDINIAAKNLRSEFIQRGRGHWTVYYWISISWFIKLSVQMIQPLIIIYLRGNLFIIIEDVHQFIGHYLIPVDS